MFDALGVTVSRLLRVRFGPFRLPPRLRRGQWLELEGPGLASLLAALEHPTVGEPAGVEASRPRKVRRRS
jgi:23S rRNA pseudouridine2605 synthase